MSDSNAIATDPARELAELCQKLHDGSIRRPGQQYLSEMFGVTAFSKDFYQIIFAILDRIEAVKAIIMDLPLDVDHKSEALAHVDNLRGAFSDVGLQNTWMNHGSEYLAPVNVQPLKMLSLMVRMKVSYPKITAEDAEDIQIEAAVLLGWLREQQISDEDFIRQALIEGLEQFIFRFSKLEWLGYGYAVSSLRDVIAAYMALERGHLDPNERPDIAAILQKTRAVIGNIYDRIGTIKDVSEKADFILKAYGAASIAAQTVSGIVGLLPSR